MLHNCGQSYCLSLIHISGAKVKITRDKYTTYNIKNNPQLVDLLTKNLALFGITPKNPEGAYQGAGSTDIGNVSHVVPTCYTYMGTSQVSPARTHDAAFLDVADSDYAHQLIHIGGKVMAASALDLYLKPEMIKELKK